MANDNQRKSSNNQKETLSSPLAFIPLTAEDIDLDYSQFNRPQDNSTANTEKPSSSSSHPLSDVAAQEGLAQVRKQLELAKQGYSITPIPQNTKPLGREPFLQAQAPPASTSSGNFSSNSPASIVEARRRAIDKRAA